jgi:hypothetical protein
MECESYRIAPEDDAGWAVLARITSGLVENEIQFQDGGAVANYPRTVVCALRYVSFLWSDYLLCWLDLGFELFPAKQRDSLSAESECSERRELAYR